MHVSRLRVSALLLGLLAVAAVTTVWAQSGGPFDTSYNAATSGGTTMGGGSYVLQTGVGQPVAGNVSSGSSYSLDVGVLAGGEGAAAATPGSPTASPSASASPSPSGTPLPHKRFGPQVAKDGVN